MTLRFFTHSEWTEAPCAAAGPQKWHCSLQHLISPRAIDLYVDSCTPSAAVVAGHYCHRAVALLIYTMGLHKSIVFCLVKAVPNTKPVAARERSEYGWGF